MKANHVLRQVQRSAYRPDHGPWAGAVWALLQRAHDATSFLGANPERRHDHPTMNGQQTLLPADICVETLIAADGNQDLAAERLGVKREVLIASIAVDPTAEASLNRQLRTLATLMTFDTLRASKAVADGMIADMDPADFAKFYTQVTAQLASLTVEAAKAPDIDIPSMVLKMLPPEARRALLELVSAPQASADSPTPVQPELNAA